MSDFSLLKRARRFEGVSIFLVTIYLLVFLGLSLSVIISSKTNTSDVSYLIEKNCEDYIIYLIKRCIHNLEVSSCILWVMIFLSLTPLGVISPWLILTFRSYSIGFILCNLYLKYHMKGMLFGIFVILPGMFASLYSLILLIQISFDISLKMIKRFYLGQDNNLSDLIRQYPKKIIRSTYAIFLSFLLDLVLYGISCFFI